MMLRYIPLHLALIHGKTVLTDRETAFVGSVNMDYRSFQLHFECGEVFYGTPAIETLLEDMDTTMARCAPMTPERMAERPVLAAGDGDGITALRHVDVTSAGVIPATAVLDPPSRI